VFCAFAVTVNTCVLKATTKKVVNFFSGKKCSPGKNPAGVHGRSIAKRPRR